MPVGRSEEGLGVRKTWKSSLLLGTALASFAGCGDYGDGDLGVEPFDDKTNISEQGLISCQQHTSTGYRDGSAFPITVVTVDGRPAEVHTANAYYVMQQAAARDGVSLRIVSGFRTMAEQQYLYGCYIHCNCNSCNLAAPPGHSNHQSGHALDLNTSEGRVYSWLSSNAARFGFRRTVPTEPWHWEWWGGGPGGGPCSSNGGPQLSYAERTENAVSAHLHDPRGSTDIDGDGLPDICARNRQGITCFLADGNGFGGAHIDGPDLTNERDWDKRNHASTIRFADINGDGRADLCGLSREGFKCWLSNGHGFGHAIETGFMLQEYGWDEPSQFTTIRMADVNGDGRADVCGRKRTGFVCWKSEGDHFSRVIEGPEWSNERGWDEANHYGTIRMGDVDGDGKDDVCARSGGGMVCYRSNGNGFGARIDGPDWGNDQGWDDRENWSTIRLVDVNGDGRADLCGRGNRGVKCHLSRTDHFGGPIQGPELSDESNWDENAYYSTIRFADLDGDGDKDLCARAKRGFRCWRWKDGGFATSPITSEHMTDEGEWDKPRYYRSIRLADIDGDGMADLCARGYTGVRCWRSTGDGFGRKLGGPDWSDAGGWDGESYGGTIRIGP
jgi:hypothetical protein